MQGAGLVHVTDEERPLEADDCSGPEFHHWGYWDKTSLAEELHLSYEPDRPKAGQYSAAHPRLYLQTSQARRSTGSSEGGCVAAVPAPMPRLPAKRNEQGRAANLAEEYGADDLYRPG